MAGKEPKYMTIRNSLVADIEAGRYSPGDRIPSDNVLMRQFGMSKSTVTRALDILVREGRVLREQGRGSFVAGNEKKRRIKCFFCPGDEAEHAFWEEAVARFNAKAGFEVAARFIDDSRISLRDTLYSAFASGNAPDILSLDGPDVSYWAYIKAIRPLDEFMDRDPDFRGRFLDSILAQGRYGGKTYHLGYNESTMCLVYNKQVLASLGVRIPTSHTDGWSWDELLECCRLVRAKTGIRHPLLMNAGKGIELARGEWITCCGLAFMYQNGAAPFNAAATKARGFLDSAPSVAALDWMGALFHRHGFSNVGQVENPFPDEFALAMGMQNSYVGLAAKYPDAPIGVMPLPRRQAAASPHGGWGLSISTQTRYPDECWAFLEYVFSLENQLKLARVTGMPVLKAIYEIYDELGAVNGPKQVLFGQLHGHSVTRPITPAYPFFSRTFANAVYKAANGEPAAGVLQEAAQQIDRHMERHNHFTNPMEWG